MHFQLASTSPTDISLSQQNVLFVTMMNLFFIFSSSVLFAQKIWSLAPFKSPLICASILSVTEGIASSSKAICLPPSGLGGGRLSPWLFWTIWSSRNQLIFNKKQTLAEDAYLLAITRAKEWQSANQTQSLPARIPDPLVIPRSHSIDPVCCTDAAWKTEGSACFGWICKDSRNQTIF